jgi:hypothetical protein
MLRDHAVSIGRWSYDSDGYVDKAPKPPKTSASVIVDAYDDRTGTATLSITSSNAGKTPVIRFSETADIAKNSELLESNPLKTNATRLWFLVTDPDGKHEQGDPVSWSNTLSLTHQPHFVAGKRTVELSVVPRGTIRWNTDGSNVKEGTLYAGPIELPGEGEVVVYAYAEDQGVSIERQFRIAGQAGAKIIKKDQKARLLREVRGETIAESFRILDAAEANKATFEGGSITVGLGTTNIRIALGSDVALSGAAARELISSARKAIGDENAEVKLAAKRMNFEAGFGLEQFAIALGEDIAGTEIEQS